MIVRVDEDLTLTLKFNCFDGGCYENVELKVCFSNPELIYLPFMASGEFQFVELHGKDRLSRVPENYLEYDPKVFKLIIGVDNGFYVSCNEIDWYVSGSGVKNKHELMQYEGT